jgi:DNA-binding Lrp family transcriptional regulator
MYSRFDLFLKVRAKDLNHTRDIIENKIRILPNIVKTELMTVLKTSKEEQIASSNNRITENREEYQEWMIHIVKNEICY